MTNFFPFFLECSKQEVDKGRKKELESLAFGNAVVITKGNKYVLISDTEEFVIPDDFSLESWNELQNILWGNHDTEYYEMENTIKDKSNSWTVTKKRDKIRRLDNLIIQAIQNNDNRKYIKIMLMRLILLKIVTISDIELQDFDVKKV